MVKNNMHFRRQLGFALLALSGIGGCVSGPDVSEGVNGGGAVAAGGGSPTVPLPTGVPAATGSASQSERPVPSNGGLAPPGKAAGFDDGALFAGADVVEPMVTTPPGGSEPDPSAGPPGDGNVAVSQIRGQVRGTGEFRQEGTAVTAVISLNGCVDGSYSVSIHAGFSCDNDRAIGEVWEGARGAGFENPSGAVACVGGDLSLTHTRTGDDPTKAWTVGDHAVSTDLTAHVIVVKDSSGKRVGCGNFF